MSNIYIQEPPTSGKVLLSTTVGDIDIELWTKETPKTCRNFIQLCMESYYNNLTFHRVVKNFIVQGGDPTGTGEGGASTYGKPFRDEFHSRLRFNRRGLVAMANAGPNDNGSQFFFTLGATPELDKKHTLFGKVSGPTVYNMLKLGDVDTDANDRPRFPMKILRTKVLHNPFSDIVPRDLKNIEEANEKRKVSTSKATKNFKLLSFGEEAEEDEEEVLEVTKKMHGKSKSSHDLTDDPRLSSVPAVKQPKQQKRKAKDDVKQKKEESSSSSEESDEEEKERTKENVKKKFKTEDSKENPQPVPPPASKHDMEKSSIEELRKQARQLKREIMGSSKKEEEKVEEKKNSTPVDESVAEYMEMREKYATEKKQQPKKGSAREEQTLALLAKFQAKLHTAAEEASEEPDEADEVEDKERKKEGEQSDEDADVDLTGTAWLAHKLRFDEGPNKVLDANIHDVDRYEIFDPRNPINKRKREASKPSSKDKRR
ncbi:spliceosome-associated protein CWC27 homolog [Lineus longissimus]|uniref:spliceosome-associated protein CWC27 homolog n=1 Tax=Lineus longissimus TaxID=88925 RepID=UPI002B4CC73F